MAAEKTDPSIGIVVGVAVAAIGMFIGLHSLLVSYYDMEEHEELQSKILGQPAEQLMRQRESERTRLENGAVPITQAMELMARGGRPHMIEPSVSVDYAPMQGWMQRPQQFVPPPAAPHPPSGPESGCACHAGRTVERGNAAGRACTGHRRTACSCTDRGGSTCACTRRPGSTCACTVRRDTAAGYRDPPHPPRTQNPLNPHRVHRTLPGQKVTRCRFASPA